MKKAIKILLCVLLVLLTFAAYNGQSVATHNRYLLEGQ